jgi:endonuclease G
MSKILRILCAAIIVAAGGHLARAQAPAAEPDQEVARACAEHLPFSVPTLDPTLRIIYVCHRGYFAAIDDDALVPRVVAYHLHGDPADPHKDHSLGCVARGDNFHPDAALQAGHRARPIDYANSGYDIGHQAPAQDFAWDEGEMSDSFSLANMAPQLPHLNRDGWEYGEATVRAWAHQRGDLLVYVVSVIHPDHRSIGPDHVAVPDAFGKVVIDLQAGQAVAWEMPQQAVPKGDLTPYLKSIAQIEADAAVELPMPASIDKGADSVLWPADLSGWSKAHKAACHT